MNDFKFSFKVKKNEMCFECQKDCGVCCYGLSQMVVLTYLELKKIQDFISDLIKTDKFEKFVTDISKFYFSQGHGWDYTGNLEYQKELMHDFFSQHFFPIIIENNEKYVTTFYELRSLYPTNRCVFLNPMTNECLIHPVKPIICKLYPFFVNFDISKKNIEIFILPQALEECPGIGKGKKMEEIKKMAFEYVKYQNKHFLKLFEFTRNLDSKFSKFCKIMAISPNIRPKSDNKESIGKKLYEARIQAFYGLKDHPKEVIKLTNENYKDFFLENDLIKPNKNFLERLNKGEFELEVIAKP